MNKCSILHVGVLGALMAGTAIPAFADQVFNRISTISTVENMAEGEDRSRPSSAEIISASEDGMTLIYSDSPLGAVGLIDITDPKAPKPLGAVDMGGEPTTAQIIGERAFIGVNTSESFTSPSGKLVTLDLASRTVVAECDIGGQPDAVAKANDGSFIAIAVENERDEDVNDGAIPQMPPGYVVKLAVTSDGVDCANLQKIALTGLAQVAADDPEPEYLDINDAGEIVVSLQENNHLVVIGADGGVAAHFGAGAVTLDGVDTKSDGRLSFTDTKEALREPDAVKWIDNDHFATANEGDYEGGSRGWTIFRKDGTVIYEDGARFERAIAEIGHYPEHRSRSKGVETESIEIARFGDVPMAFVASERASIIGVYDLSDPASPVLVQLLPSGVSPEGIVAIPSRNLIATANEVDLVEDGGVRAHVMVYERAEGTPAYPMITSAGTEDLIGWGALSGLVADTGSPGKLFAVSDSVYGAQPAIFEIDATQTPARIVSKTVVTRGGDPAQKLDLEGITTDGEGGFWLASEGRTDRLIPHALLRVDADGAIQTEVGLPPELASQEIRFGFEGIAKVGDRLWMPVQREWKDDPKGQVKLVAYDIAAETWGAVRYPLDAAPEGGWMGLSELTIHGDWAYIVERDNQTGSAAVTKRLYRVALSQLDPVALDGELPLVTKELVRDFLPDLAVLNGYAAEKIEGFAVDAAGMGWVVTDNDGVDDSSGETLFWSIGAMQP